MEKEDLSPLKNVLFGDGSMRYSLSVENIGSLHFRRRGHTVSQLLNGTIIVIGGECDDNATMETRVESLESQGPRFLCSLREGVSFHSSCVFGNDIYVVGGFNGTQTIRYLYRVKQLGNSRVKMERKLRLGKRIDSSSMVVYKKKLVIFGGWDGISLRYNSLFEYFPNSNVMRKIPVLSVRKPRPRNAHSAVVFNGRMFIFGGNGGKKRLGDTWSFDFSRKVWTQHECANSPSPRSGHSVALVGGGRGQMLLVGGFTGKVTGDYGQVYLLDLCSFVWRTINIRANCPSLMLTNSALCKLNSDENNGNGNSLLLVAGFNCYDFEEAYSDNVYKLRVHDSSDLKFKRLMMRNTRFLDAKICLFA